MARILILLLLLPSIALALDVTLRIDGKHLRRIDADRVNIITSDDGILIDVRTEPKTPAPPSPPPAPPKPPPPKPPSTCDQRPPGVSISTIDWRSPGGQKTHSLGSGILAFRFTTTNSPAYEGQVSTAYSTTGLAYRTVWISKCPGSIASVDPNCIRQGFESAVLHWTQNPTSRVPCKLALSTMYYINVKNATKSNPDVSTCQSGNCPFAMIIYTNQQP